MGLCEVISEIALLVASQRAPLSEREAYLAFILQGMPYFRNIRRLDLWEAAYQEVAPDTDASQTEHLFGELFELGRYNLYGAFSQDGIRRGYEELKEKFIACGVSVSHSGDILDW